jgi:cytochrome c oxidase subunit 2
VLLACFVSLAISPAMGWWLPKNVSSFGGEADFLFYIILYVSGFFFVLTEVLLVWFMWKYAYDPARKVIYIHGNKKLEGLWTVVPAGILLYIAFAQVPAWAKMKSVEGETSWFAYGSVKMKADAAPDQVMTITARQWEWRMRYLTDAVPPEKGRDKVLKDWAETGAIDDLHGVNEVHTWKGAHLRVYLRTLDVIHSFFLPNFRVKQDALPGRTIPIWFKAEESNCSFDNKTGKWVMDEKKIWELTCAELCGSRHYAMRGLIYVHETKADYDKWFAEATKAQKATKHEMK